MLMFLSETLFLISLFSTLSLSTIINTAPNPVRLSLKKTNSSFIEDFQTIKTKPQFFQNVLDLTSGSSFHINVNKWNALKQCGLFANLSAKSFLTDGGVAIAISGVELNNHIKVRPEFTVTSSRNNKPLFFGGLMAKHRNFRGLGETLEVSAFYDAAQAQQAVSVNSTASTSPEFAVPSVRIKWHDCAIGKDSRVSCGVSSVLSSESPKNTLFSAGAAAPRKVSTRIFDMHLNLEGRLFPRAGRLLSSLRYALRPYRTAVQPAAPATHSAGDNDKSGAGSVLVGIRSSCDISGRAGGSAHVWHDIGHRYAVPHTTADSSGALPMQYSQVGCHISLPALSRDLCLKRASSSGAKAATTGESISASPSIAPEGVGEENHSEHRFSLLGKLKFSAMKSWGDGCLPLYHRYAVSSDTAPLLRGLTPPSGAISGVKTVSAAAVLKGDVYLDTSTVLGKVGVFVDCGAYQQDSENKAAATVTATTAGLSLRSHGFRLDVGAPVQEYRNVAAVRPRLHFCLDRGD